MMIKKNNNKKKKIDLDEKMENKFRDVKRCYASHTHTFFMFCRKNLKSQKSKSIIPQSFFNLSQKYIIFYLVIKWSLKFKIATYSF